MQRVYIIAEAGVNHNGSEDKARTLVDIAADSGADAVKFQLFDPQALVTKNAPTAEYQAKNLNDSTISQEQMLQQLTLPKEAYVRLQRYCATKKIDFLCTPFDHGSLDFLVNNTPMPYLKLPSGEVTNGPLLLAAARTGLPIILSTGMAKLEEINIALSILHFGYTQKTGYPLPCPAFANMLEDLHGNVTLLHCVSQYPAPKEASNLRVMNLMQQAFGLLVGLSDHTQGFEVALAAVSLGAVMIEKHFTYDTKAPGPDHAASLMPDELKAMVAAIRSGAPFAAAPEWLGDGIKRCQPAEESTRVIARKSLVAARPISKGEVFSEQNLTAKRPGNGPLAPNALWSLLGKAAKTDYAPDAFINATELS